MPPRARGGLPTWAIALISVVGGIVVLGVLAAVAIPVFLAQRAAAIHEATSVSVPATAGPLGPIKDQNLMSQVSQAIAGTETCGCFSPPVVGGFEDGSGTRRVIVFAARFTHPAQAKDQSEFVRGFWRGVSGQGMVATQQSEHDPGSLGGSMTCAPMLIPGVSGQACLFVDAGAFVTILDMSRVSATPDPDFAVDLREAVEHRA